MTTAHFLKLYYYITPLFLLIDLLWEQVFRVAGFNDPIYRYYYYGVCTFCALVCYLKPRFLTLITLMESSVNMMILIFSVMLPIFSAGNMLENGNNEIGLSGQRLINFILMGSLISYSFYSSQLDLQNER